MCSTNKFDVSHIIHYFRRYRRFKIYNYRKWYVTFMHLLAFMVIQMFFPYPSYLFEDEMVPVAAS